MSKTINCLVDHKGAPCACDMSIYENLNKPIKTPTQNDWKKEFQGWAFDHDRRYFKSVEGKRLMSMISKFLTDARREVIEKVEKELEGLDCGFCNYEKEVKERLATLRKEGK